MITVVVYLTENRPVGIRPIGYVEAVCTLHCFCSWQ